MKIKTESGFELDFDETKMDNMEVLDALVDLESDVFAISKLCKLILSKEDKKRLYDHLREADGRVPLAKVGDEIRDLFLLSGGKGKN